MGLTRNAQNLLIDEPAEHLDTASADMFFAGVLPALAAEVTTRGTHGFLIEHDVAYRGAWLGEQQDVVGATDQ